MIPFIAAGIGLVIGAGAAYFLQENDKDALRRTIIEMEASQRALELKLRVAGEREAQHRKEKISLLLQWSKSRMETVLAKNDAPLMQLQRVWATGKALQQIADKMPANGELPKTEQEFIDVVVKAQRGDPLSRVERAQIEDYLATNLGNTMRDFLEDRLASMLKVQSGRLRRLDEERIAVDRDLRTAEVRQKIEGARSGGAPAAIVQLRHRGDTLAQEITQTRRMLQETERTLVVVARLTRPDDAKDEYDRTAERILERAVRNQLLSDEDWEFLSAYRDMYFLSMRDILKNRRNIDIAEMVAA